MGNVHTQFMQACGPVQLARMAFVQGVGLCNLREQGRCHGADAPGLGGVNREPLAQPHHGAFAQIGLVTATVNQVIQGALSQRAFCDGHVLDVEQVEHGTQHTQAAADDQFAVVLDAFQPEVLDRTSLEQAVKQPVQVGAADGLAPTPIGCHGFGDCPDGTGRPIGHVPLAAWKHVQRLVQHGFGRNLRRSERTVSKGVARKVPP